MKTLVMLDSGPNKNHRKGQRVTVDDARAAILLDGRHAREEVTIGNSVRNQEPEDLQREL